MTSDPKAPGAPAEYLYREEITDNFNHFVSTYARIKVFTELGKEWATVEIPYRPEYQGKPIIEGRTIHADGSIYPLAITDADLVEFQRKALTLRKIVVNLPNVTVGSILEYRWTRPMVGGNLHREAGMGKAAQGEARASLGGSVYASETPEWEVQAVIPIRKERFYFNPFNDLQRNVIGNLGYDVYVNGERASYLLYTERLPPGVHVAKSPKDDFSLEVQDVPATTHESNSPPEFSLLDRVRFYYTAYTTADVYWDTEIKRWSKQLDQSAAESPAIKSAAGEIAGAAPTAEAKARKLYDLVAALDNADFSPGAPGSGAQKRSSRSELRPAEDVLREKSGTGNELAALYLALTRAAGLEAYGIQVSGRDRHIFDPRYLSLDQLDVLLVLLRIDGKDLYLDPGEKLCPFGQLAWQHTLAGGIAQNSKAPVYTPPNQAKDALTGHVADLTVDSRGGVTGTVEVLMNGPAALYWRQLNLTTDPAEVQKQFDESLHALLPQGISGEVEKFQGMDTSEGYLSATVKVSGQSGTTTGKRLFLPGFFFSAGERPQFVSSETRETAIDLHYAEQVIDDVTYRLPAGYAVESAPQPAQLPWPEHAALVVKTRPGANSIDIQHIFARAFVVLDPKEYPALRDYYQKLATSGQQQVVLAPAAAAGGQ